MATRALWFVYLLRCGDGSLYTGVAKDVVKRLEAHSVGKGAKYTRGRGPFELLSAVGPFSKGKALGIEAEIKKMPRDEKLRRLGQRKPRAKRPRAGVH